MREIAVRSPTSSSARQIVIPNDIRGRVIGTVDIVCRNGIVGEGGRELGDACCADGADNVFAHNASGGACQGADGGNDAAGLTTSYRRRRDG